MQQLLKAVAIYEYIYFENMVDISLPKQGRAWVRDFDAEMPDCSVHTFSVPTIKEIIPLVYMCGFIYIIY